MEKKIIYGNNSITVIIGENTYTKYDVEKAFIYAIEECTTEEEIKELMSYKQDALEQIVKKLGNFEWEEFLEQEINKVITIFKADPKKYILYKTENGVMKLARDILTRTKDFKEKNNEIIGNLAELYSDRLNLAISKRIVKI